MLITHEDRKLFDNALETFKDKPLESCVALKVISLFLNKTTPVKINLPPDIQVMLALSSYDEYTPHVGDELRKCWNIIGNIAEYDIL